MAEKEAGSVVVAIRATAENLEQVAEEAKAKLQGIGTAADKTKKPLEESGKAGKDAGKDISAGAQEAQLAWLALAAVAVTAFRKMREAVNQGVADTNAYKDALRGLSSVADYAGVSQGAIEEATAKVTNEFFNAEAAATSLKNLLLRGFSLDQAVNTIQRLQDSAAYGRQASLTLSDAVKSATEGLKNENSILVDNAGVTKNVAKMWEEYAKQRGISTAAMTQAQRVEAEYLGIQQETAAMTGDLASLQDTLSGKMAKAENQAYLLSKAFGEANTQLKAAETDLKNGLLQGLTELVKTFPGVTAGATTATGAFVGMTAAVPVLKKVVELWKSLQVTIKTAKVSMGTLGWVALGLGAVTTAFTAYKNHLEKVAQEEEKRIQQNKDAVKAQQDRIDTMKTMINRYVELKRKQRISITEATNIKKIEDELEEQYGLTREELDKLVQSTGDYADALDQVAEAAVTPDLLAAQQTAATDSWNKATDAVSQAYKKLQKAEAGTEVGMRGFSRILIDPEQIEAAEAEVKKTISGFIQAFSDSFDAAESELTLSGGGFNRTLANLLTDAFLPNVDTEAFDDKALIGFMSGVLQKIKDVASDPAWSAAAETIQTAGSKVAEGLMPTKDEIVAVQDAWGDLFGADGPFNSYLQDLIESGKLTEAAVTEIMTSLQTSIDSQNIVGKWIEDTTALMEEQAATHRKEAFEAGVNAQAHDELAGSLGEAGAKYAELEKNYNDYYNALQKQENKTFAMQDWLAESKTFKGMTEDTDGYAEALANLQGIALELGYVFDGTPEDLRRITDAVNLQTAGLSDSAEDLESVRAEMVETITELLATEGLPIDEENSLKAWLADLDESMVRLEGLEDFSNFFDGYKEQFTSELDAMKEDILDMVGGSWSDELADGLSLAMRYALGNMGIEDEELGADIVFALIDSIAAAASDADMEAAMETITAFTETIQKGIVPDAEQVDAFMEAWETMLGEDSPIITGLQGLVESGKITAEQMEEQKESILGWLDPLNLLGDTVEETAAKSDTAASLFGDAANEMSDAEKAFKNYQKTMKDIQSDLKVTSSMVNQIKA